MESAGHPSPDQPALDRRAVLRRLAGGAAAWCGAVHALLAADALPAFDEVRQIPQVADGVRCHCGCADSAGHRSLLSCYEGDAMARECPICRGQGRLAFRLARAGRTLDEIRAAVDARYG